MASMEGGDEVVHKKGPGVKKAKKLSTRVDMTPMVDLGFLLITFFIFTTTMSSPTAMQLYMPKDTDKPDEQNKAKESGALTIMLGDNDHVYYYEGQLKVDAEGNNFKTTNFKGIRDIIINKKKDVMKIHQHDSNCQEIWQKNGGDKNSCLDKDLVIVIKPNEEATYKNTVDILDEMTINSIRRFAMVDISPEENQLIKATEASDN